MIRQLLSVILVILLVVWPPTVGLAGEAPADSPTSVAPASRSPETVPPQFEAVVPEPQLVPGVTQQLTIQVINDPDNPQDRARTARDVRVAVGGRSSPVEVVSGTRLVGSVPDGRSAAVTVRVTVPADAAPGTYRIPVDVTFEHQTDDGDVVKNSTRVFATVRIDERPRFRVIASETTAPIGETGTVNVTLRNVGAAPAANAVVTLQASNSITFDGSPSASQYVGAWEPGQNRSLQFDVSVAQTAHRRTYSIRAVVAYENPDGLSTESRPLQLGITPLPEQTFALRTVETRLHVGEDGELTVEVSNTGTRPVESVVVRFVGASPTVSRSETQYAVGSLAPGETTVASFAVTVSETADPGPRQFTFRMEYRTRDGRQRTSDPLDARVAIGQRRPVFTVEPVASRLPVGGQGTLTVRLTNNRNETLRDVSGKLFADDPIAATDDEVFVPELAPGESTTIRFGIAVAGSAMAKTYPIEMDFRYVDAGGESHISDAYQVPVAVTEPRDTGWPFGGSLPVIIVAVALLITLIGGYIYRRRH